MTTVDQLVSLANRIEEAERQREPVDWRRVVIAVFTLVPYVLGKTIGFVARGTVWMVAATVEGYRDGRNAEPVTGRRPRAAVTTVDG